MTHRCRNRAGTFWIQPDVFDEEDSVNLLKTDTNVKNRKTYYEKPFARVKRPHYVTQDEFVRRDLELFFYQSKQWGCHPVENGSLYSRQRRTRKGTKTLKIRNCDIMTSSWVIESHMIHEYNQWVISFRLMYDSSRWRHYFDYFRFAWADFRFR